MAEHDQAEAEAAARMAPAKAHVAGQRGSQTVTASQALLRTAPLTFEASQNGT